MQITILTFGSRGDVQPYVALGRGLVQAGYQVTLATHANFESVAAQHGLNFAPIAGNPKELLEGETGLGWIESGDNALTFSRTLSNLSPIIRQILDDSWKACHNSEAIVFSVLGVAGYHIAQRLNIPCIGAWLQPITRTNTFASILVPSRLRLGRWGNWLSHLGAEQLLWQSVRRVFNDWQRTSLGLPKLPLRTPYSQMRRKKIPVVYGFSSHVLPKPADWPTWVHVSGYWFLDSSTNWQPPTDLLNFLAAGSPPVCIGFGSMTSRNPDILLNLAAAALKQAKQRGILLIGWGGLRKHTTQQVLSDDIFIIDSVPHDWLFPQVAAVVHHGGAGTTAAGLRAGVPSVIVPFFADQPFWGKQVANLGVGPPPIPRQQLSADGLAKSIKEAVTDKSMQKSAANLGRAIRAENGVSTAVEIIGDSLSRWKTSRTLQILKSID